MKKFIAALIFACALIFNGGSESMKSLEGKNGLFAVIATDKGDIVLELYYKQTPLTVTNFVGLAEGTLNASKGKPFYDGLKFHRVIADFMIQGGDPKGNGSGGPGYKFADEIVDSLKFTGPGVLAMANAGPGTNGSQFFITHVETPWLNGHHTIFGHVVDEASQAAVNAVAQNDVIKSVKIIRRGEEAEKFTASQVDFDRLVAEVQKKAREEKEKANAAKIAEVEKKFPGFNKDSNGIFYKETKAGSGNKCGAGKFVATEYKGYLVNGSVFDQSKGRGPLEFKTGAGEMIPGFDIMVQDMKLGEKRTVVIPSDLAYGDAGYPGVIPGGAYIAFDIELVKIK
ncbi:peptidylprolyl isomerase [Treponema sp.]|uniref:peptidylprolyl isomerase n=1 Tax=Treponema sp. TaxID=166 RepID=UPI003EFCFFF9